ncbi:MAG TPA: helix-turn-helix transcriptional regulator [Kofleriaceae bacterium]|nr:helix-turn-helix transcriptional regulator [Kofleriaceae bacterium]
MRKALGWSSLDLADTLGVDASTVSRWENGKQDIGPQADRLLRLLVVHESAISDYEAHDLRKAGGDRSPDSTPLRFRQSETNSWQMVA